MEIEIDPSTREPVWLFPFEGMSVGDSFFIPTLQTANMLYVLDVRAKVAKVRIKAYAVVENGYLGVRAWRIS
jgi:hypothetical protein